MELVEGYDWEGSADDLEEMMRDFHVDVMSLGYKAANRLLPVDVSFDQSNPAIKKTLDQLAKKVRNVTDTTRNDIRALVDKSTQEGWSVEELSKRIIEKGNLSAKSRPELIALTESGHAYNLGGLHAYDDAGVTHVDVLDGDVDDICAEANGQRWTLEEARANPLGHPGCQRAFVPVVE